MIYKIEVNHITREIDIYTIVNDDETIHTITMPDTLPWDTETQEKIVKTLIKLNKNKILNVKDSILFEMLDDAQWIFIK